MKSSPYENNPYTSSSEAPHPAAPPGSFPCLQAAGRPSWPYSLALLAAFTANSLPCTVAWPWAALWESSEFSPSQPCIF